jgi:hypothetical protein
MAGGIVGLGARCRAILRVARAHGIDGAGVLRDYCEMWLPIIGLEGRYDVSSRGRVRSVKTGRILKTPATGPFYPMVALDGRTYRSPHTDGQSVPWPTTVRPNCAARQRY